MLQIRDISKEYRTGTLVQKALDHVSLNLRDNEFVAILGPSGSGKTTLLNIIGGLDRYDSGDLIINGVSTKQYKDKDWDSYRNHTIGFVFQSYNLIPHQTVLANVELALTIGGISRTERKERALEALEKVGLKEQAHKKPNQMSGGQMQRVAIARALVNDPDILLADEPTGALDSDTSIQVMELLKEVAKDRLVVMVTHNPELAEEYATRIVRLRDGVIRSDTDPYEVKEGEAVHRNLGRASMSFLTALSLSFNNLRTKITRTLLVAFAGSIGIIGIALIMSLANGVNGYIKNIEEQTLTEYPLAITSQGFDMSSMVEVRRNAEEVDRKDVMETQTLSSMFSTVTANDLASLKDYLESGRSNVYDYTKAIEYSYSITPQIYREDGDSYRQVNPDQTMNAMGLNYSSSIGSMFSSYSSSDVFHQLPDDPDLYIDQYELKAGKWPENYNECILILTLSGNVTDMELYAMGLKDASELDEMIKKFSQGEPVDTPSPPGTYTYDDFMGITFKVINSADLFVYDSTYEVWTDKSTDTEYMKKLVADSEELTIVGVAAAKEDSDIAMLTFGINYPSSLTYHLMEYAAGSEIVKSQLKTQSTDVITNTPFGEKSNKEMDMSSMFAIDTEAMENAFQFDMSAINLGSIDMSDVDFSSLINVDNLTSGMEDLDLSSLMSGVKFNLTEEALNTLFQDVLGGYLEYAAQDPATDYSKLPESLGEWLLTEEARTLITNDIREILDEIAENTMTEERIRQLIEDVMAGYAVYAEEHGYDNPEEFNLHFAEYLQTEEASAIIREGVLGILDEIAAASLTEEQIDKIVTDLYNSYTAYAQENSLPDPTKLSDSFGAYLALPETQQVIAETAASIIDYSGAESAMKDMMASYGTTVANEITNAMRSMSSIITSRITSAMTEAMSSLQDGFSFDADSFSNAITLNFSEKEMQELFASMMSTETTSYSGNLYKMGYADLSNPASISIYPIDFEGKGEIKTILDNYNETMKETDQEEKVVRYTDIVGTLMSSVTDIINAISYVLIGFVAISLIVSSIMIGVITYISVLERRKEIGILRAIGASKHNISQVFNAETFIIGILAGLMGVGISRLLLIPGNMLIHHLTGEATINASLPVPAAIVLVILSVILTLLGGLIPSGKAAKSDPVTALRTE